MGSRRPSMKPPVVFETERAEEALALVYEKYAEIQEATELLAEAGGIEAKREALLLLEKDLDAKKLEYASERDDLLALAREQAREITDTSRFEASATESTAQALIEEATRRLAAASTREDTVVDREDSHARVVSAHEVLVSEYHADVSALRITKSVFADEIEVFEQERVEFDARRDEVSEILYSTEQARDEMEARKTEVAELLVRSVTAKQDAEKSREQAHVLVKEARAEAAKTRDREHLVDARTKTQEETEAVIARNRNQAMQVFGQVQSIQKRLGLKESQEQIQKLMLEMQNAGR